MKATIPKSRLEKALASVAGAVKSSHPKAVLQCVHLRAEGNDVTVTGNDLENMVAAKITGVNVDRPGQVVFSLDRLRKIVSNATEDITIDDSDDRCVIIKSGKFKTKLPTFAPEEYPSTVPSIEGDTIKVSESSLALMIPRCIGSIDEDSTRFQLGGVNFCMEDDQLIMIATDGRRLTKATCPAEIDRVRSSDSNIINAQGLKILARALSGKGTVTITIDNNAAVFKTEDRTIYTRQVEGRFPNWKQVIPASDRRGSVDVSVSAESFLTALKQVSVTTGGDSCSAVLLFSDGNLNISTMTADLGESTTDMAVPYSDDKRGVRLDIDLTRYFAQNAVSDEEFSMNIADHTQSVVFSCGDDYLYVIMPMAIEKKEAIALGIVPAEVEEAEEEAEEETEELAEA